MPLRPFRARLTVTQAELILADADHFFDLCAYAVHLPDLCSRECQAIGGVVFGAVSDDQDLQATSQSALFGPIGVTPIGPERLPIEAAILLDPTHEIPAIVPNAF